MLFNVIFGNEKLAPDKWTMIQDNGTFYEKADIRQRVRIDPNIEDPHPIEEQWSSNSVQAYDFGGGVRFLPNGSNLNGVLRPIIDRPNVDKSQQILVYVTVMNNYHLIDFTTEYQILGTYHSVGKWQGAIVALTTKDIEECGNPTILTFWCYNRKKDTPCMCTVSFTMREDENVRTIDADHVITKITPIKDKEEKQRVMDLYNQHGKTYLGFKCRTKPMQFMTYNYFTSASYEETALKTITTKKKNVMVIPDDILEDHDKLRDFCYEQLHGKNIRAITLMNVDIPLDIISENRLLYVFKWDPQLKILNCIKSN